MSVSIPMPLRAAAGLAAAAIDEARRLPDRLIGLPVLAVSTALQASLKAQQRYIELVARGDQLLEQLRGQQESTPAWARFDDDESARPGPGRPSAFDVAEPPPAESQPPAGNPAGGAEDLATDLAPDPRGDEEMAAVALAEAEAEYDRFGAGGPGTAPEVAAAEALEAGTGPGTEPGGTGPGGTGPGGTGPGGDEHRAEEEIDAVAADPAQYERYLDTTPPLPGYDQLTVAQLRGKLRTLSEATLVDLIAYERGAGKRPAFLSMLENRLASVRAR